MIYPPGFHVLSTVLSQVGGIIPLHLYAVLSPALSQRELVNPRGISEKGLMRASPQATSNMPNMEKSYGSR